MTVVAQPVTRPTVPARPAGPVLRPVTALPTGRPARAARPALRLTRRGRVLIVLVAVLGLLTAGFTLGHVGTSRAAGITADSSTVVQPGDTLWSIAARVAPTRDTRGVVAEIEATNHISNGTVQVGQRLLLPN